MSDYTIDPEGKLTIVGLEGDCDGLEVTAQFNPKEVGLERSVPWQKQKKKGPADLEYTGGEPKTMSLELLFDGFEGGNDVSESVAALKKLIDPVPSLKRPPKCTIIWGESARSMPRFDCIVEKVSVKYQMFAPDGGVLRATCTVSFKEAAHLFVGKKR